jgi:hypothetical protein
LAEVEGDLDATGPLSGFFSYASTALTQGAKLGGVISETLTGGVPGKYGIFEFELDGAGRIVGLRPITNAGFASQLINVSSTGTPSNADPPAPGAIVVPPQ